MIFRLYRSVGPVGSITSNAEDMAKWLLFWLNEATTHTGDQILCADELKEFLKPEAPRDPRTGPWPSFYSAYEKYAKGFNLGFYRGIISFFLSFFIY